MNAGTPMWLYALIFLFMAVAGVIFYGVFRWKTETKAMRAKLHAVRVPLPSETLQTQDLDSLPEPVQRFFRAALPQNPALIAAARITQTGTFNTGTKWSPFTANQLVITNRPGFDWDARIAMAPGANAFVHDSYIDGIGILHVEAMGLIPLMDMRGTPEMAQGELQRFFAEAAWYPTRLLPSYGVEWEAIDSRSAAATMRDGDNSATLSFHFNADGLIEKVRADARYRVVDGVTSATPWEGRFWDYELRAGMQIPMDGEVYWLLPSGPGPYWRGRITSVEYEFEKTSE
ncbi:MAG: DUF6920 family protein [Bryobacteraceae bacterium]